MRAKKLILNSVRKLGISKKEFTGVVRGAKKALKANNKYEKIQSKIAKASAKGASPRKLERLARKAEKQVARAKGAIDKSNAPKIMNDIAIRSKKIDLR